MKKITSVSCEDQFITRDREQSYTITPRAVVEGISVFYTVEVFNPKVHREGQVGNVMRSDYDEFIKRLNGIAKFVEKRKRPSV